MTGVRTDPHTRQFIRLFAALVASLGLVLGVAAAPASAATSGYIKLETKVNRTIDNDHDYYIPYKPAATYRISVDKAKIAKSYNANVSDLDWSADVYITGPDRYWDWDFVWGDSAWQSIYFIGTPKPGTYTVTINLEVDGWTRDYDYVSYTRTVKEKIVLKATPVRAGAVTISGTAKVGSIVTAKTSKWTSGTKFSYQWYANKKPIRGAKAKRLTLAPAQRGKKITVRVTGSKPSYAKTAKTSKGKVVAKGTLVASKTAWLDTTVTFYAESHFKPTTGIFGEVKVQGSAGRAQPLNGAKVEIQRKTKSGWKTVKTTTTKKDGWYGVSLKAGYGKDKGDYRVVVRKSTLSKSGGVTYKSKQAVSRSAYFW